MGGGSPPWRPGGHPLPLHPALRARDSGLTQGPSHKVKPLAYKLGRSSERGLEKRAEGTEASLVEGRGLGDNKAFGQPQGSFI